MSDRELIDEDGENRAVRTFLQLYGGLNSPTVGQMRDHLEASGFEYCWPTWVDSCFHTQHLTKGAAQSWLRHLFGLEVAESTEVPQSPEVSSGGTGISSGDSVRPKWTVTHNGKSVTADTLFGAMKEAQSLRTDEEAQVAAENLLRAIDEELAQGPVAAQPQDVKAIHSAVLALQCDPCLPVESRVAFLAGVHRSVAVVSQFAAQPVQDKPQDRCAHGFNMCGLCGFPNQEQAKRILDDLDKPQEAGQARELTTTELSDPEYMHEYVSELHATIGELLAAHAAPAATVGLDALREAVSDLRKAACEFGKSMGPDDHKRMMEAQKRIFDAALADTLLPPAQAKRILAHGTDQLTVLQINPCALYLSYYTYL